MRIRLDNEVLANRDKVNKDKAKNHMILLFIILAL